MPPCGLLPDETLPLHEQPVPSPSAASLVERPPQGNCSVKFGPLGLDERRKVLDALTTYLLNLVEQTTPENENVVAHFAERALSNAELFCEKQRQYGLGNVQRMGEVGLVFRDDEKMARMREAVRSGYVETDEPLTRSWADISNIATMAQIVRDGKWPGTDPRDLIRVTKAPTE